MNGLSLVWQERVGRVDISEFYVLFPLCDTGCDKPLGLQSGWVENKQIRASSIWSRTHAAWRGRLHMPKQYSYPGAWIAKTSNVYQWIEVSKRDS